MAESFKEECIAKSRTIRKLQLQIGELQTALKYQNKEIEFHIKEKQKSDAELAPVRETLNQLTAENSRLLRKQRRANNA